MEEKERFELFGEHCIKDNNPDARCQLLDTYKACVILNEQDKEIKELETTNKVLSNELTKNNIMKQDRLENCCGIPIYEIPALKEENQQLKQQLAEKDKEIEQLNACVDFYKSYYISFNEKVINELEKVKEFVSRQLFITTKDCNDLDEAEAKGCNELREETIKEIDNQINGLKEGK